MMDHKEGCLYNPNKPGWVHRVPIECTTREDFEAAAARMNAEIKKLEAKNQELKANLYDYEHSYDE
jgi:hypothetical protein